ncbi:MAG: hypothetical protein U1E40_16945 [Amaricoccus sp.]
MLRRLASALLFATVLLDATLAAAAAHVRGQVTAIAGDVATVETTDGATVELTLKPDFGLVVYRPITLADLHPDDYLSIPSTKAPDGRKRAITIGVFPPNLHGVGEGESPWDRGPDSRMTNAALATLAAQGPDHTIVVRYKGTEETIEVPAGTPILAFAADPDRKLAVGDKAFFFATETGGKLVAGRAGVMADGSMPPM